MAIRDEPHVLVSADELAKWVEGQGDQWWSVDGDPLLSGRVSFPCPGDELASAIRRVGRPLLIRDRRPGASSRGQAASADVIGQLARTLTSAVAVSSGPTPTWAGDRLLALSWKDGGIDWLLTEDSDSAAAAQRDATAGVG